MNLADLTHRSHAGLKFKRTKAAKLLKFSRLQKKHDRGREICLCS